MAGGLRRSDSIADMMPEALRQSRYHMKRCFQRYVANGSTLMKRHQILEELRRSADDKQDRLEGFLGYVISSTQEAVVLPPYVNLAVRTNPGIWEYIKVHSANLTVEQITPAGYLKCKETLTLPSSIGNGMHLVSRFMSSRLAGTTRMMKPMLDYLLALRHRGEKLMVNDTLDTVDKLQTALLLAEVFLAGLTDRWFVVQKDADKDPEVRVYHAADVQDCEQLAWTSAPGLPSLRCCLKWQKPDCTRVIMCSLVHACY